MPLPEPPLPATAAPDPAEARPRPRLPSLQGRLILLVFLALLPLLALALTQVWDAHRLRTAAAHSQAAALADSLSQHHAALLRTAGRTLSALSALPAVATGPRSDCAPVLATVAAQDDTFVNLARASADGVVDCTARETVGTLPPVGRAALQGALRTGRLSAALVHVSDLHRDVPVMPIALPLWSGNEAPPRALVGAVRLAWFDALRDGDRGLPANTVVVLTDLAGQVIVAHPALPGMGSSLPRQPAPTGEPEIWPGLFEGDHPRVVASAFSGDGLRIVVGISRDTADGDARDALLVALAVSVAALLLALVAGQGIARVLVIDPLQPLRRATARLARGDFAGRIGPPYRGPAELVDLAQAFDTMADRIAERELELINSETKLLVKRQSEERYRTLVERAPEAIVVVSGDVVAFANGRAAEVFGTPDVQTLIGTPLDLLMAPTDPLRALLEEPPADGEPTRLHESLLHRLQHGTFWAECALAPVDYAGRAAWHVVVRDVTARKEVERQLAQASKLATLGEVAAGLAHELSQPMNVIRVAAESASLADTAGLLPASTREHLALIADQAAKVGEIIDHVRVFSRPEPGQRGLFDAFAAARRAVSFLEQQIRDDGITLDLWFAADQAAVDGVAVHVEQIILNLLTDARASLRHAATTEAEAGRTWRPRIMVTGRVIGGESGAPARVVLTVGDNAGLLDDSQQARVFDPFSPGRRAAGAAGPGHGDVKGGLGLSICYALATAMGGTLGVHNEDAGRESGAVFTLSLPAAPAPAQEPPGLATVEA